MSLLRDKQNALRDAIGAVAPVDGVALSGPGDFVRIDFQAQATAQQRTDANAVVAGFDWSDAAQALRVTSGARAGAKADYDLAGNQDAVLWRAIALTLLDQINTIRAALPTPLGPITVAQARTAIRNKIDSGVAD